MGINLKFLKEKVKGSYRNVSTVVFNRLHRHFMKYSTTAHVCVFFKR